MGSVAKVLAAGAALVFAALATGCGSAPLATALPTAADTGALPAAPTPEGAPVAAAVAVAPALHTVRVTGDVPLSLSVPTSWTLQDTVFMDGTRKIAELSPGAARMPGPDACQDWPEPDPSEDPTQVLQQSRVTFGGLHGIRRVEEAPFEGVMTTGIWYPVAYCLQEGGNGLYITFYADKADALSRAGFDRIAGSAVFTAAAGGL
jgi:hypothetical protein